MDRIVDFFKNYISWISFPELTFVSVFELILLTVILYVMLKWMKKTKAWSLMKGIVFLFLLYLFCYIFKLEVFLFLFEKAVNILIIGLLIVFAPELRKALEDVGKHNFMNSLSFRSGKYEIKQKFSDKSVEEIIEAVNIMSKAKTGALMLFEQNESLSDYDSTGISVNADITKQLIINIFEKNTPLHDGALTFRNDRVAFGTCYLPLSENMEISKDLGTRHRAALGASENKDCYIVVVSEETGAISVAYKGQLYHNISERKLREFLRDAQQKEIKDVSLKNRLKEGVKFIEERINGKN